MKKVQLKNDIVKNLKTKLSDQKIKVSFENKINIINPIKEKYEEKILGVKDLIKSWQNYGAWRILIKEEKNGKSCSI